MNNFYFALRVIPCLTRNRIMFLTIIKSCEMLKQVQHDRWQLFYNIIKNSFLKLMPIVKVLGLPSIKILDTISSCE